MNDARWAKATLSNGPAGKPRNVKAMCDRKLHLILAAPNTNAILHARVLAELATR